MKLEEHFHPILCGDDCPTCTLIEIELPVELANTIEEISLLESLDSDCLVS